MNKEQFLHVLGEKLSALPAEEKQDVLGDLDEYFDEGIRDGKSEQEIAASLGTPESIASDILSAYPEFTDPKKMDARASKQSNEYELIEIPGGRYTTAEIMTETGAVRVIPSTDGITRIELIGKRNDLKFDANINDGKLSITLVGRRSIRSWFSFGSSPLFRMVIHLPKKLYDSLLIRTENGSISAEKQLAKQFAAHSDNGRITVRECAFRTLDVKTDNGRIEVYKAESDTVQCVTDNGRIELTRIRSGKIWAETDNGRITLDNVEGAITGKTDNGRIELSVEHITHPIDLKTDNGSITVDTMVKPADALIRVRTDNGHVELFGERTKEALFGDGRIPVKLESDNGKILVRQ
ncbi:MAG: DUF4097 family beta strand repeat-containing protein [Bhargavaea sp.]